MEKLESTYIWYKRKGYLHLDYAKSEEAISGYVMDPASIEKHAFSPFIHYIKKSRRYRRDKKTKKLVVESKSRDICYASHVDSYIYSYYNHEIGKKYEAFLTSKSLDEHVLAYRKIEKEGVKFCNIHMAQEAFTYVKNTKGCNVVCLDISGFFDSLCPKVLKQNWCEVIGETKLPPDQFNVYLSLVNFTYVDEVECIENFGIHPRRHKKGKDYNLHNRLCSYSELRQAHKKRSIIRDKSELKIMGIPPGVGIPQGSPISGLVANIFMIHFDMKMKEYAAKLNGFYRRYSDDIFFAFPKELAFAQVVAEIQKTLEDTTASSLQINPKKTEERTFSPSEVSQSIQYLGFIFDGKKVYIRNSSVSKNRTQIAKAVRKNKKGHSKVNTRAVYKAQSILVMSPYDKKRRGFVNYAIRAVGVIEGSGISEQIIKNTVFIKKKINSERKKKHKAPTQ